ncbi:MAG: protein translocase subunit SecF [Actinobacteria bacterium]|nr:protein translocase subunit SecF [Actinomycetota bacterium]
MSDTTTTTSHSIWYRLYHGETAFDFIGRKNRWFVLSAVVILAGLVSLVAQGLNFGIDFKGGTAWEVKAPHVTVADARSAVRPYGLGDAKIQIVGGNIIRVEGDVGGKTVTEKRAKQTQVSNRLAKLAHTSVGQVSINDVGPSWGKEISQKAERALIFFLIAITLYITFRFEWKMAVAALIAMLHDILVTVGIYSLSRFEVTPATVIAFLTILGYSLYDTIVVFDKVEENTRGLAASGRLTYADTVNLSMNQVLMRSLNTSLVAILPILSVLVVGAFILGATTLQDFGLALLIGLLTGAYSSIFIASPLLAVFKEREPRYATIRQRLVARGAAGGQLLTPAAAAAGGMSGSALAGDDEAPPLRPGGGGSLQSGGGGGGGGGKGRPQARRPPPRPRKKKRR